MGWLIGSPLPSGETPISRLKRSFEYESDACKAEWLDAALVGRTVYAAIRNTHKRTGESYVFAAVILIRHNSKEFGYKDMTEGMDPVECDCPERIMRRLSPVADIPYPSHTAEWRERVRERQRAKAAERKAVTALVEGARFRLPDPISFRSGVTAKEFRVTGYTRRGKRRRCYVAVTPEGRSFLCRVPARDLARAQLLPGPE